MASRIQQLVHGEDLGAQRACLQQLCTASGVDLADCAAALLWMLQSQTEAVPVSPALSATQMQRKTAVRQPVLQTIKLVRYRLDVGRRHQVNAETLKKVLVEESGVDHKNIANIDIQDAFTLIDLPDEMPPDIFQHLKSVEINKQKLDIRRVKNRRFNKRGPSRNSHQRQPAAKAQTETA